MLGIRKEKEFTPIVTTSSISASNNTNKNWGPSAISADGSIVYACANNDYIYKSIDGGLSFQPLTSLPISLSNNWSDIATSDNGQYILASIGNTSDLFLSTDGGLTWSTKGGQKVWASVSMSSNGQKMVACNSSSSDTIYISTDFGNTWVATGSPSLFWRIVKISGNGNFIMAISISVSSIYTSNDNGVNWSITGTLFGSGGFTKLALSNTGQYLIINRVDGPTPYIYISQNFGTDISTTPVRAGGFGQTSVSLSISSSGQYMTYSIGGNTIGVSSNFGTSFTTNPGSLGSQNWRFSVMSSDGSTQLLGVLNTSIYKSTNYGSTFSALPTGTTSSVSTISYITTEFNRVNSTASKQIK